MRKVGFESMGFVNLSLLYISNVVSCFFVKAIYKYYGMRACMVFSGFTYLLWTLVNVLLALKSEGIISIPNSVLIIFMCVAAIINGFGFALLWSIQGKYISDSCNEKTKGLYWAIFWAIF